MFMLFFFSSRRRHTRSKRDWSSDVCSSDLTNVSKVPYSQYVVELMPSGFRMLAAMYCEYGTFDTLVTMRPRMAKPRRSEERRVGKECRNEWWQEHIIKKKECLCSNI